LVGVVSLSSRSDATAELLSSFTVLNRSANGVSDLLLLTSVEEGFSLAVINDSALDEGYANMDGRDVASDSLVLGGLGSGVGGLRWFTGVLKEDRFEISEDTTPSAYGGGLKLAAVSSSRAFEGGVGGKPVSVPVDAAGDASGVRSCEDVSSSLGEDSIFRGSVVGAV
jgi:hypothetical protein